MGKGLIKTLEAGVGGGDAAQVEGYSQVVGWEVRKER